VIESLGGDLLDIEAAIEARTAEFIHSEVV
jgi:hypothetical protein